MRKTIFMMDNVTINTLAQTIYDKKGINIIVLDVKGVCSFTDYFIVAEGTVDRHVKALGEAIQEALAKLGRKPLHVEGEKVGDWVVLDYGEMVIHLFTPGLRDRYAIERLWSKAKLVDVELATNF